MTAASRALSTGVTLINGRFSGTSITSLRMCEARITALGEAPMAGDIVIDLHGDRVLPGLINAHDHLQLNSLPALDPGHRYERVQDWISDINTRQRSDPSFDAGAAVARDDRLLIGGVKNLLSGVTTVAHHDPLYPPLFDLNYPTGIVAESGWSHSLYIDGEEKVRASHRATPADQPWIMHAAEGVAEDSAREFERLDAIGCIGPNTLLVHGVALDSSQRRRLIAAGAGVIWCPSSNLRLFGATLEVAELRQRGRLALGTDSRLSGARDLLDELRIAAGVSGLDDRSLEALVTRDNARLLHLADRGSLQAGSRADILVLPAGVVLGEADRTSIRLVVRDGRARYGDSDYAQLLAPDVRWANVRVDGVPKLLDAQVAARLSNSAVHENGVEILDLQWRAA
jgi:cytosine/adenosine deaminase-related metal-dependent hydrolase